MTRLAILVCAALLAAGLGYSIVGGQSAAGAAQSVTVYKSPT